MSEEPRTLKYEVNRTNNRISITLVDGDRSIVFTAPAKDLVNFLNALDASVYEAMAWTLQNAEATAE